MRRMIKEARWNVELINVVRGLPWDHQSGADQGELPAEQQLKPLPEGERLKEPTPQDSEVIRRDFKIFRNDVIDREKAHGDGFTPDCPGCTAIRAGTVARNHTNICRDRYADIFMQCDKHKHRVILAIRRLNVDGEAQAPVQPQQEGSC